MPRRREGPIKNKQTGYYFFDSYIGLGPDRKRVRFSLHTKDPGRAQFLFEQEWKRLWAEYYGLKSPKLQGQARLADIIPEFITYERQIKKVKCWRMFEQRLWVINDILGNPPIVEINQKELILLDQALRIKRAVKPYTVNHYFGLLKTLFNYAIDQGKHPGPNPIKKFKPYPVDRKRRSFTDEETHSSPFLPSLIYPLISDSFPIFGHSPTNPEVSLLSLFLHWFGQDLVKIIILTFMLLSIILTSGASHDNIQDVELIQILKKEYSDWEGDKTEKLFFICLDRQTFLFRSSSQNNISIRLADIIRTLARSGNSLASVLAVVHNHKWPDDFSEEDKALFRTLWQYGFRGRFLVYYPEKGRIKELMDPDL